MKPIEITQTFNCKASVVWKAITHVDQMNKWFFENIPDFSPEVGFETSFNVKAPSRDFIHIWKVIQVSPLQSISYKWTYKDIPGDSIVTFSLTQSKESTTLKLVHEITDNFPDDFPEFSYESGIAGWTYFINERLPAFLIQKNG